MSNTSEELSRTPLGQQIADHLRRDILFSRIGPDDKLTQERLCERFGTSRIPVRDALLILAQQGFVESAGSGVRAVQLTEADLEDLFYIEASLHALATRVATLRMQEGEVDELTAINDEMEAAHRQGDSRGLSVANGRFHREINHMANSPRLLAALRGNSTKIHGDYLALFPHETEVFIEDHRNVLGAMRRRDERAAFDFMFEHVLRSVRALKRDQPGEILDSDPGESSD